MSGGQAQEAEGRAGAGDAFRLGGEAPHVVRLSRKALAIAGGVAGIAIAGALIYALTPDVRKAGPELLTAEGRPTADALAAAPRDYSQVPKLGPPLPGDLGGPMLEAQRGSGRIRGETRSEGRAERTGRIESERERTGRDRETARTSGLFLARVVASGLSAPQPSASSPGLGAQFGASPETMEGAAVSSQRAFLDRPPDARFVARSALISPAASYLVQAGSVIPAALLTGVRSDLPGVITAQVTQNVYDSLTGRTLLIPQGARLIGEYDAEVTAGQTRLLMAWTRLILPDGRSAMLERLPGADAGGYSGLRDGVDAHWAGLAKAALVSTVLGLGAEMAADEDGSLVRALRRGTQDTVNQAGQQLIQRQVGLRPTLTIRPGHPLRIMVTRDLILQPGGT